MNIFSSKWLWQLSRTNHAFDFFHNCVVHSIWHFFVPQSVWNRLIMYDAMSIVIGIKLSRSVLFSIIRAEALSFLPVSYFTMAWNCLKNSSTWSFVLKNYTHTFWEAWSIKVKKKLLLQSDSTFKGPQTSECTRISSFDLVEELLKETFCCLPTKQWLKRSKNCIFNNSDKLLLC